MIIRQATAQDARTIAELWAPFVLKTAVTFNAVPKTAQEVAGMIEQRPCFLVCEDADGVGGFVTYDQFRGGVGYAHTMEHTIILAPSWSGRGAGRALMEAALKRARDQGVHSMWAGVSAENPDAVAFHASIGFDQIAVLPQVGRKFDRWMDLVLMQKRL